MAEKTVPCRWCGKPTPMTGTRECNAHWELRSRVESDPEMARRMLAELDQRRSETPDQGDTDAATDCDGA